METRIQYSPKYYWDRTPKKLRKIGDAFLKIILGINAGIIAAAAAGQYIHPTILKWNAVITFILTIGKFVSNQFKEVPVDTQKQSDAA